MAECPFCHGDVSGDLLVHGGRCPRCLIEIPGEETPTDPGVAVSQEDEATEQVNKSGGVGWFMSMAAVGLLMIMGGAWKVLAEDEPAVEEEPPEFYTVPLSKHQDLEVSPAEIELQEAAKAPVAATPKKKRRRKAASTAKETPSTGGSLVDQDIDLAQGSLAGSIAGFSTASSGPRKRTFQAIVLSDPGQIDEMVRNAMTRYEKHLQQCYESRLKEDPNLAGAWSVYFVIETDGATSGVKVQPLSQRDQKMEACMLRNIEDWRFQAINSGLEVNKTFRFGPGW